MKRAVLRWMGVLAVLVWVGCSKGPATPPKPPAADGKANVATDAQEETTDAAAKAPDTAPADAPPADKPPADTPPADTKEMTPPAAGGESNAAATDVKPPAEAPATKYAFEDLVAALGNEQATEAYRNAEAMLASDPKNLENRVQRLWILHGVGGELMKGEQREKGLELLAAALEQAQALSAEPQPLADPIPQVLSMVFYNGACARSVSGKPEEAQVALAKAVELGWKDINKIKTDEDLAAVRALAGFEQQLEVWAAAIRELSIKEARELLAAGETFPFDFALTDLAGQNVSLASNQGKVLIVDIWGTWCPPCRAEIPSFVRLQNEYGPQGLQIVGLNYENGPDEAAIKEIIQKFMQENSMNYPCAIGTEAIQTASAQLRGLPHDDVH